MSVVVATALAVWWVGGAVFSALWAVAGWDARPDLMTREERAARSQERATIAGWVAIFALLIVAVWRPLLRVPICGFR